MSNINEDVSSESDDSCSSQFESSDQSSSSSSDEEENFSTKRTRRRAKIPFDVDRYTPTLNMNDVRDMGRKHYLQNETIMWINGLSVNKKFCLCTSSDVNKARLHMKKTFAYFQSALSPRRFLLVVFSFIYLITLHYEYELPQYRRRHKYVCQRCTMLEWWSKSYNDRPSKMVMFLYVNYVAPQQFKHKCIVNSIERYLLKKYSFAYIPCYIKTLPKYMNECNVKEIVNKIVFLLYRYGARMSESSADFSQNQLVQLCITCSQYKEFAKIIDIIDISLSYPKDKQQPHSLFAMTYFKVLRLGWFNVVPVLKNLRINMVWNEYVANLLLKYFYENYNT